MERYDPIRVLGEGSFGKVYLMRDKVKNNLVCIKIIKIKNLPKKEREATKVEVDLMRRLHHPNIVRYIDSFLLKNNESLCISMEYCDGGDLASQIKAARRNLFSESKVLHWFVQIALGIHYMHNNNVLHRDLKTQNIFLLGNGRLVIGDLGISKVLDGTMDFAQTCIGTPYYMSPEIFKNKPYSYKSDVWALGCILYEMTTLNHAFDANSLNGLAGKIIKGRYPPINHKYSKYLRDLINDMLMPNPQQRPDLDQILKKAFIKKHIVNFFVDIMSRPSGSIGEGTMIVRGAVGGSVPSAINNDTNLLSFKQQLKQLDMMDAVNEALSPKEIPTDINEAKKLAKEQMNALKREEDHKRMVEAALEKLRLERENKAKERALLAANAASRQQQQQQQMQRLIQNQRREDKLSYNQQQQKPQISGGRVSVQPALPVNAGISGPKSDRDSNRDGGINWGNRPSNNERDIGIGQRERRPVEDNRRRQQIEQESRERAEEKRRDEVRQEAQARATREEAKLREESRLREEAAIKQRQDQLKAQADAAAKRDQQRNVNLQRQKERERQLEEIEQLKRDKIELDRRQMERDRLRNERRMEERKKLEDERFQQEKKPISSVPSSVSLSNNSIGNNSVSSGNSVHSSNYVNRDSNANNNNGGNRLSYRDSNREMARADVKNSNIFSINSNSNMDNISDRDRVLLRKQEKQAKEESDRLAALRNAENANRALREQASLQNYNLRYGNSQYPNNNVNNNVNGGGIVSPSNAYGTNNPYPRNAAASSKGVPTIGVDSNYNNNAQSNVPLSNKNAMGSNRNDSDESYQFSNVGRNNKNRQQNMSIDELNRKLSEVSVKPPRFDNSGDTPVNRPSNRDGYNVNNNYNYAAEGSDATLSDDEIDFNDDAFEGNGFSNADADNTSIDQAIEAHVEELEAELMMTTMRCNELKSTLDVTKSFIENKNTVNSYSNKVSSSAKANNPSKGPSISLPDDSDDFYIEEEEFESEFDTEDDYPPKAYPQVSVADDNLVTPRRERVPQPSALKQSPYENLQDPPTPSGRLSDRIEQVRIRCIHALGEDVFNKVYFILKEQQNEIESMGLIESDKDEEQRAVFARLLGEKVHFLSLIEQLIFMEDSQ